MTQEEKAKEFDASLERAKKLIETCDSTAVIGWCEYIFPMLKDPKADDERIRKGMLQGFKDYGEPEYVWWEGVKVKECIAWLEKQGEQKPADYESVNIQQKDSAPKTAFEAIKGEKVDNANKVEHKFKVGDWITNGQLTCKVLSVTSKSYELHLYNDDYYHFGTDMQRVDNDYHLWTIKDAKNGDVLVALPPKGSEHSEQIFIFKEIRDRDYVKNAIDYHCRLFDGKLGIDETGFMGTTNDEFVPSTKEEQNLLFSRMKEKGWSWNPEIKELSQLKVTKISDQDGMATDIAIKALNHNTVNDSYCKENCKGYQETGKCYADWDCEAKRKAEQNLVWSEEDEEQVSIITDIVKAHCGKLIDCRANLKWLKSLKERLSL